VQIAGGVRQGWSTGAPRRDADFSTKLGALTLPCPLAQTGASLARLAFFLFLGSPALIGDAAA
jgi:hypothetical protein